MRPIGINGDICCTKAQRHGAAVPVVAPVDSMHMRLDNGHTQAVERSRVMLVQTPQTFRADLLLSAYAQPYTPRFTDDASVVEAAGIGITTFAGQASNIILTTPHDMAVAEYLSGMPKSRLAQTNGGKPSDFTSHQP